MTACAALPLLVLLQKPAAPPNLAAYLRANGMTDVVAVGAEAVRKGTDGAGLDAYGRKTVRLGTVNAVVPKTITAFDDAFSQPPNLYEGLPLDAKALYLLTLLTPAQRTKAVGRGIALDDLQGEARAVLASLLPRRLSWSKWRVRGTDERDEKLASGTVEGKALEGVRLRFVQTLSFNVEMEEPAGSSTSLNPTYLTAGPGEVQAQREIEGDEDRQGDTVFGVALRRTVENRPKPGALDARSLVAPVVLSPKATVGEALAAVGRANGREILADLRVRDLSVTAPAKPLRGGDLLEALALAVGGAYRKVGGAYLLTADAMGMGVRQVRVKAWEESVRQSIYAREAEWRKGLAQTRAMNEVGFADDDPTAPNDSLRPYLDGEVKATSAYPVQASMLTPGQRAFLARAQAGASTQKFRLDRVGVQRFYAYRFVLPDGTPVRTEGGLGYGFEFREGRTAPTASDEVFPATPPVALPTDGPAAPLLVRTDAPAEAARAAELARSHGLRELWVETVDAEALKRAVATDLPVRLVVRPWDAPPGTPSRDLDRTMFGDDGALLRKRIAEEPLGLVLGNRHYEPARPVGDVVAPGGVGWSRQGRRLAALAATPGLRGIIILGTAPRGYEGARDRGIRGDYPAALAAASAFGYTDEARLAFVRKVGVDPIDLGWRTLFTTVDLRPDFFPDDQLASYTKDGEGPRSPAVLAGALDAWDEARGKANVAATLGLLSSMPALPLEIEGRSGILNSSPGLLSAVVEWRMGDPLPVFPSGMNTGSPDERYLLAPRSATDASVRGFLTFAVLKPGSTIVRIPATDLTRMPASEWSAFLDATFARSGVQP